MDKFKIKDSEMTEIFRVNSKYFDLTAKKKLEVLLLMDEWVKTELKKLKNTSSNSDYAKCGEDILMLLTSGGEIERERIDAILKKHFA